MMNTINETSFWNKIKKAVKSAGQEVIEKALWLFYAAQDPNVPLAAKTTIYTALAYFILPTDLIPDFLPMGYTDDLGVLIGAVSTVSMYITEEVKQKTSANLKQWFGE
ncbi:MAG: DUF1232 domain-containing protein [Moraxellaceae bacterium]|nr:DUF1232 domain-containing protein [Moraxellaceae bacterium]